MKTFRSDDDQRWERLVQRARRDTPPATDLPALLRAVHSAAALPPPTWFDELLAAFAFGRAASACVGGIGVLLLLTSWQVWDSWPALVWAEWLVAMPGGVP